MQGCKCSVNTSNDYYFVSGTMLSPSYSRGTSLGSATQTLELDHLGSLPSSPLVQTTSLCLRLPVCKMGTIIVPPSLRGYGRAKRTRAAYSSILLLHANCFALACLPGMFFPALHMANFFSSFRTQFKGQPLRKVCQITPLNTDTPHPDPHTPTSSLVYLFHIYLLCCLLLS